MPVRERAILKLLAGVSAVACVSAALPPGKQPTAPAASTASPDTRLILFITVDAMRADYLERFGPQLTDGLARLYRDGAVFTNAYQDHAITETAPGHSATMSGRFPVHTGIVANITGVGDSLSPMIGAPGLGASPVRFKGTTLTDWLIAKDPRTRVLSVSRKDRGAILPIGRSKQPVFWYASNGTFTTSTYYSDTLPAWVREFNSRAIPAKYAGRSWDLLLNGRDYPEPDSVEAETGGQAFLFPHVMPEDSLVAPAALSAFPWMDELTLQFAYAGLKSLGLGKGPQTDLLAISLSTTDAIGHAYGPDSREVHDQILRLDRMLGVFLDSLYSVRDSRSVLIALTADHGLGPYPEVQRGHDPNRGAIRTILIPVLQRFSEELASAGVPGKAFWYDDGVVTLDRATLLKFNVRPDTLVEHFRRGFLSVPGVLRANRLSELMRSDTVHDAVARRWLHMFDDERKAELLVTLKPYNYPMTAAQFGHGGAYLRAQAQHGVPHDYDAHVPVIFHGASFRRGRYDGFARVVDMAPTIAAATGTVPLERLDGHVLTEAFRPVTGTDAPSHPRSTK